MDDYYYMKVALNEAKKAYKKNEIPVGAVIVKNDKIISKSFNKKEKNGCALEHAELITIKKASKKSKNWRLYDTVLYVTLEPCPMCASAIKQSRINKVVYLFKNNNRKTQKIVNEIFTKNDANKSVEIVKLEESNFDNNELEFFSGFFKKIRK